MRISRYEIIYSESDRLNTGKEACFACCKEAKYFAYIFSLSDVYAYSGMSKLDSISRTVELTNMLIEEFGFDVKFELSYVDDGDFKFSFETKTKESYDIYAPLIMSRFFVSDMAEYHKQINQIDYLVKKGYSVMESYLISSLYGGFNDFSYTGRGLYDIYSYREIKNKKKKLFNFERDVNNNFMTLCKIYLAYDRTNDFSDFDTKLEDLEKTYFSCLEKVKDFDRKLIKFDIQKYNSLNHNDLRTKYKIPYFYSFYRDYQNINYFEKTNMCVITSFHLMLSEFEKNPNNPIYDGAVTSSVGKSCKEILECLKLVDIQDFIKEEAKYIESCLTKTKTGIMKNCWLYDLSYHRGFDLIEEINKSGIFTFKLRKWKKI